GCYFAYVTLPKALLILFGFTPDDDKSSNIQQASDYFTFITRFILAFGLAWLLPVFLVLLNLIHLVSSAQLAAARKWAIFGFFVLGAFANPSGDPVSMMALALPMAVMYVISELICRANEKRRGSDLGIDPEEFNIKVD
ncbi:MAG: twin-arginine translocase subunit TatC, partial [Cutibacterium granulosum]